MQNGRCVKSECKGTFENASRVNPSEKVVGQINSTLVATPTGQVCEWRCKDNYVLGKGSSGQAECLQCKAGTRNTTTKTCVGIPSCQEGYVAAPGPDGVYKCFPLGNCLDKDGGVYNYPYSFYNRQYPRNYRPIAKSLPWTYVSANPREHQCQYTCASGYWYDGDGSCIQIGCKVFHSTESLASTYKNTPEAPSSNTPQWSRTRVSSEAELAQKRNSQAKGCYYYCPPKNQYKQSWWEIYCYSEERIKEEQEKENSFTCGGWNDPWRPRGLYLSYLKEENPQQKDHPWTYVPDKATLQSKKWQAGCFWTCAEGYTKGKRGRYKGCYKPCKKNEYWDNFTFWECQRCPAGKIWDSGGEKIFGNPTTCKDACKKWEIWTPAGGEYGSCISSAGQDLSCPSGMTLVIIKGEHKCLACLPWQTFNKEKGVCE